MRLGRAKRRAMAMGATASGGDTTAPSTKPTASGKPNRKMHQAGDTGGGKDHRPHRQQFDGPQIVAKAPPSSSRRRHHRAAAAGTGSAPGWDPVLAGA